MQCTALTSELDDVIIMLSLCCINRRSRPADFPLLTHTPTRFGHQLFNESKLTKCYFRVDLQHRCAIQPHPNTERAPEHDPSGNTPPPQRQCDPNGAESLCLRPREYSAFSDERSTTRTSRMHRAHCAIQTVAQKSLTLDLRTVLALSRPDTVALKSLFRLRSACLICGTRRRTPSTQRSGVNHRPQAPRASSRRHSLSM